MVANLLAKIPYNWPIPLEIENFARNVVQMITEIDQIVESF